MSALATVFAVLVATSTMTDAQFTCNKKASDQLVWHNASKLSVRGRGFGNQQGECGVVGVHESATCGGEKAGRELRACGLHFLPWMWNERITLTFVIHSTASIS